MPSDPGWTLIDDDGCKQWFNPNDMRWTTGEVDPNTRYCGGFQPPEETDADANVVDASDGGDAD